MLGKDRKIEKDCRFSASEDRGQHTRLLSSSISLYLPLSPFYLPSISLYLLLSPFYSCRSMPVLFLWC